MRTATRTVGRWPSCGRLQATSVTSLYGAAPPRTASLHHQIRATRFQFFESKLYASPPLRHLLLRVPSPSSVHSTASVVPLRSRSFSESASATSTSSSSVQDFVPIDLEEELARLRQEVEEGAAGGTPPKPLSSPTRVAGLIIEAGNAGRTDVLQSVLELVDVSGSARNRGLFLTLLAQTSRLRMLDAVMVILERLEAIEDDKPMLAIRQPLRPPSTHHARTGDDEHDDDASEAEMQENLDRPHAYYNAFRVLMQEYSTKRNIIGVIQCANLMSRSGTKASAAIRKMVTDMIAETGVRPLLDAIKHNTAHNRGSLNKEELHPSTFSFLLRCLLPLTQRGSSESTTDVLRIATQATYSMWKHRSDPNSNNSDCFWSLLQIYRTTRVRSAIMNLLMSYGRYNIKMGEHLLEIGLPILKLEGVDTVIKNLRQTAGLKPSLNLYNTIAMNVHHKETVDDLIKYFISNLRTDHPNVVITPMLNEAMFIYAKTGERERATALFNLMQPANLRLPSSVQLHDSEPVSEANTSTYTTYLNMLQRLVNRRHGPSSAQPNQEPLALAERVFDIASKQNMIVQPPIYYSLFKVFLAAKEIGRAEQILQQMRLAGHEPNSAMYNELIEALKQAGNNVSAQKLQYQLNNKGRR